MQLNILRLDSGQGRHGLAKPAPVLAQDPLRLAAGEPLPNNPCQFVGFIHFGKGRKCRRGKESRPVEVWQRAVGWPQGWEVALCRRLYYSSLGFCMAGSAWLSSPCLISRRLLSAHPSVDKWPAGWLLVTLPGGGGLLKLVSGNLGWSPRWGVSPWRRPGPASPLGL